MDIISMIDSEPTLIVFAENVPAPTAGTIFFINDRF